MNVFNPNSGKIGGYSETDGTIDFYSRINCLINQESIVLDFGAGRGIWFEDKCEYRKNTRLLKNKVKILYGCDIDKAVLSNKSVNEALLLKDLKLDLPNNYFDLIVADYVLEHIANPESFKNEINRLLKPGGWFCARTPHKYNLVSIFASLIHSKYHKYFLRYVQPNRFEEDIFPTVYKLNTRRKLNTIFFGFIDKSFIHRSDPSYFFGNKFIYFMQKYIFRMLPAPFVGNLFIFKQKI